MPAFARMAVGATARTKQPSKSEGGSTRFGLPLSTIKSCTDCLHILRSSLSTMFPGPTPAASRKKKRPCQQQTHKQDLFDRSILYNYDSDMYDQISEHDLDFLCPTDGSGGGDGGDGGGPVVRDTGCGQRFDIFASSSNLHTIGLTDDDDDDDDDDDIDEQFPERDSLLNVERIRDPSIGLRRRSSAAFQKTAHAESIDDDGGDDDAINDGYIRRQRRHSSVVNVSWRWNISEADALEIMMNVERANVE